MRGSYEVLWERITHELSGGIPDWKQRIKRMNQVEAVEARQRGNRWSDDQEFKALVLSVLSNSTDWAKVEKVLPDLDSVFSKFRLAEFAGRGQNDIMELYAWFTERRAGSITLRKDLMRLRDAARFLIKIAERTNSLDQYFESLVLRKRDLPSVAVALGSTSSPSKLLGLRIPLAAEFLKNIGYDVSKPDRHINRAVGSFGWVEFRKWSNREDRKPPVAREDRIGLSYG
jgi:3-methyladenine DNA glycosylase Tag